MIALWFGVALILTLLMAIAWAVQRRVTNAGWVDVFWTYGTGLAGAVCALAPLGGAWRRRIFLAVMVGVWAARLGSYIALRVARSPGEDARYIRFREEWGADYQRRMARFVIVQGPIAALFAGAVMLAAQSPRPFPSIADFAGGAVFCAGLAIEAIADWQMRRYRAQSSAPGSVCDRGLWSVSRHPNYVGEWVRAVQRCENGLICADHVVLIDGKQVWVIRGILNRF
jgi:steroid 5-alpha reductase family enzyme